MNGNHQPALPLQPEQPEQLPNLSQHLVLPLLPAQLEQLPQLPQQLIVPTHQPVPIIDLPGHRQQLVDLGRRLGIRDQDIADAVDLACLAKITFDSSSNRNINFIYPIKFNNFVASLQFIPPSTYSVVSDFLFFVIRSLDAANALAIFHMISTRSTDS